VIDSSPLSPVPEFSARQVVGADVLPRLRWMLAPAAVAGHRLASGLRLLLRLHPIDFLYKLQIASKIYNI
jgi:hypothetical protein